jgi:branched-chain amino acid transport system permease protein
MVGSFIGFSVLTFAGSALGDSWLGISASMLVSMIIVGCLGIVIQRVAYVPMLKAHRLSILITALAVSMILYNSVMTLTDGEYLAFTTGLDFEGFEFGNVFITQTQVILVCSTAVLMIILHLFIGKTMYGKAMRAISIDKDACRLMGINVNKVIAVTFFIGSALAAAAGVMAGVYYGSIYLRLRL